MNIEYTGRNGFEIADDLKEFFEKKLKKLARFVEDPVEIHLILTEEKDHRQVAELNVVHRHGTLHSQHKAEDMRDAVHAVVETTAKQARRARKKFMDQRRRSERQLVEEVQWQAAEEALRAEDDGDHWPVDVIDGTSFGAEGGPRIVETHSLPIKPMTLDEASVRLQQSKNDFFVFLNSSTDSVSVLYRRKDDNFGLIAPEF